MTTGLCGIGVHDHAGEAAVRGDGVDLADDILNLTRKGIADQAECIPCLGGQAPGVAVDTPAAFKRTAYLGAVTGGWAATTKRAGGSPVAVLRSHLRGCHVVHLRVNCETILLARDHIHELDVRCAGLQTARFGRR